MKPADPQALINARLAPRVGWQMWLDPGELRIRQPETISAHHNLLLQVVNHTIPASPTILRCRPLRAWPSCGGRSIRQKVMSAQAKVPRNVDQAIARCH